MYSRTAIRLRAKDGVVLAVEKLVHSKLLVPDANRRIQTIHRHISLVSSFILLYRTRAAHKDYRRRQAYQQMGGIWRIEHETKHRICGTLIDRHLRVSVHLISPYATFRESLQSPSDCLGIYVQAYTLHYTRQSGHSESVPY